MSSQKRSPQKSFDTARGMAELAAVLSRKGSEGSKTTMDFLPAFKTVLENLDSAGIAYMIVGSLAVIV